MGDAKTAMELYTGAAKLAAPACVLARSVRARLATRCAPADDMAWATNATLPRCVDGSAYVGLLASHNSSTRTTYLQAEGRLQHQLDLVRVLVRSLRRAERRCRRDFVLMVGDAVPLGDLQQLAADGIRLRTVSPLIVGSPASDKLHAWRLTEYARALVLDSDVMFLESADDIFEEYGQVPFAVAHHASDLVQGMCGLPLARRGVGAMYLMQPSLADFHALLRFVESFRVSRQHFEHYGEQTALNCYFKNASATLPPSRLYDLGSPASTACKAHATPATCLQLHRKNCAKWSGWTMRHSCVHIGAGGARLPTGGLPSTACDALAGSRVCDKVSQHAARHAAWSSDVRAVHFKGNRKPWKVDRACRQVTEGALRYRRVGAAAAVSPHDALRWDAAQRCVGPAGRVVHWAGGEPVRARACCDVSALLSAAWHGLLLDGPVT